MKEAFKKVCKIHSSLPSGGILVFLTGRQEVNSLSKMLRDRFPFKNGIQQAIDDDTELYSRECDKDVSKVDKKKTTNKVSSVNLDL